MEEGKNESICWKAALALRFGDHVGEESRNPVGHLKITEDYTFKMMVT